MSESRVCSTAEASLGALVVAELREQLLTSDELENQAHAKRVLAAYHWSRSIIRTQQLAGVPRERAERLAVSEVAVALTCSTTIATKCIDLGWALVTLLPFTRVAFVSGHLDHRRVEAIWRATRGIEPETVASIEPQIIAAAHRMPPGKLAAEIERLLIDADPAQAGRRRRMAAGERKVTTRSAAFGMAWLEAHVTAEEAIAIESMIDEVATTACPRDPRDKQERRIDALIALLNGERFLACRCDDTACPAARQTAAPDRRKPHIFVHVDLATLLTLADNPAVLAGHGPIAPEIARMLAQDATWQPFIQEGKRLAEHWIAQHGVPAQPADDYDGSADDGDSDGGGGDDAGSPPDDGSPDDGTESEEYDADWEDFIERSYSEYLSRGNPEPEEPPSGPPPSHHPPTTHQQTPDNPLAAALGTPITFGRTCRAPRIPRGSMLFSAGRRLGPVYGDGAIYAAIDAVLAADPHLAQGICPDGHSGHDSLPDGAPPDGAPPDGAPPDGAPPDGAPPDGAPPDGALTYRPDAATARAVRARDGHCRHPGCTVPARRCELDHIVPFDHTDPRRGGWTIASNLHCLCKRHHDLKTWGLWRVVLLRGHAELWTSATGQRALSLPDGYRSTLYTFAPAPDEQSPGTANIERPRHLRHAGPADQPTPPDDDPPPF